MRCASVTTCSSASAPRSPRRCGRERRRAPAPRRRRRRRLCRDGLRAPPGRPRRRPRDARRPPQLPPVPAAALPGGDVAAGARGHLVLAAADVRRRGERRRQARGGRGPRRGGPDRHDRGRRADHGRRRRPRRRLAAELLPHAGRGGARVPALRARPRPAPALARPGGLRGRRPPAGPRRPGRAELRDRRRRAYRRRDGGRAGGPHPRHDEHGVPRPCRERGADPPRRPRPHAARAFLRQRARLRGQDPAAQGRAAAPRRRGQRHRPRPRHARRRDDDPDALRDLGRRDQGAHGRRRDRAPAGPRRPNRRRARLQRRRCPRRVGDRRHGQHPGARRRAAAAARLRRPAERRVGGRQHPARRRGQAHTPVPLPRQGHHGDDRPRRRDRRGRPAPPRAARRDRVLVLARRPRDAAQRRAQPHRRVRRVGLGLVPQGGRAAGARPQRRVADRLERRRRRRVGGARARGGGPRAVIPLASTTVDLARAQFALTSIYHFLFVPLTLGLAPLVAVMQTLWHRTGEDAWYRLTRFFGTLLLINFAIGVATGLVQEFQFGMNWSVYSAFVGNVFGAPLAIEGLAAFFLESVFLGLWIFGWDRLSPRVHLATIWLVSLGTWLSAYFILVANSFMQHPVGYKIVGGQAQLTDVWAVLTNRFALVAVAHTLLVALTTGSLVILGVASWHILRGRNAATFRKAVALALIVGLPVTAVNLAVGSGFGIVATKDQPMKISGAEALWNTEQPAGFSLFQIGGFGQSDETPKVVLQVPDLLSWLATGSFTAKVEGLNQIQQQYVKQFGPGNYIPPVRVLYWSMRVMAYLGTLMFALCAVGAWLYRRRRLEQSRWFLWSAIVSMSFPFIAATAGWLLTEVGRQPWIVQGLLRTANANSPSVSAATIAVSLAVFATLYTALGVLDFVLLRRYARIDLPETPARQDQPPVAVPSY